MFQIIFYIIYFTKVEDVLYTTYHKNNHEKKTFNRSLTCESNTDNEVIGSLRT